MKKIIFVIILILAILAILAVIIFLNKQYNISNLININKAPISEKVRTLSDQNLLIKELVLNQKIPVPIITYIGDYLGFCEFKNQADSLNKGCKMILQKYLGYQEDMESPIGCAETFGFEASLYMIKTGKKDDFLKICQEYFTTRQAIGNYGPPSLDMYKNECNSLWDNKFYEDKEYCDLNDKNSDSCTPIFSDEQSKNCPNKINIKEISFDKLQSTKCKIDIPFWRANQKDDCYKIEDSLTRLLCLDIYDNNLCNEAKAAFIDVKLSDFVAKYQLTNYSL